MNRSGSVWLKVFLVIGIILLLILAVAGFTIYQAMNTLNVVKEETAKIQVYSNLLIGQRDCNQIGNIEKIEVSFSRIENSVSGACKNPILSLIIKQSENVPVKCENISQLKTDFESKFKEVKIYCENPANLNASIGGNLSKEELMALAQKYGIKI